MTQEYDVIVVGAGAAGLICAIEAGKRGRTVLVLDSSNKPGKKIIMSGGGRCNFTNLNVTHQQYISHNPHFHKSALSRYTQWDFIDLVKKHGIAFHEKKHGQLFCDNKSKDILDMLLHECESVNVTIRLNIAISEIENSGLNQFKVKTQDRAYQSESLVIATGGLSIPTLGASPFGYKVAEQFDIKVWPVRAGLVPITLHEADKTRFAALSGVSNECTVESPHKSFHEDMLFTHRGLSGPAILQISSYWHPGEDLTINLMPMKSLENELKQGQREHPNKSLKEFLARFFPRNLISIFIDEAMERATLQTLSKVKINDLVNRFQAWTVKPNGTEGYRTAEVTIGGVDCNAISSKTMEANTVKGLYFIGEVLDVSGWLGGYNFQWAWSSGWAAGQVV